MEDFNSKYTGEQVEELLDMVANGEAGGGITAETDPIFSASPAASITDAKKEEWDNKVDKVNGKQLSTEDFTTALKTKLEGLSNYDDTELSNALSTLREDFDNIVSGDTTTAIKTFNEVIAFLEGIQDTQDLSSIIASIEQQIAGKMDKVTLSTVATSGSYNDLSDKPTIPPAVTESTVSGWGFTKNTGTYSKPSGGIPASDLAPDVFLQGEKGEQGAKGDKGDKGDTGATGATGANGKDGADGEDGATFTPSVDSEGNLSWSNNKGLTNPPTVNIKGPKGDAVEGAATEEYVNNAIANAITNTINASY